jgi:PAS domain S-box-containing protein
VRNGSGLVVEASPNGIVLVNEQGRIELLNACTEKVFGYGRKELIGQTIEILVPERLRVERPAHRAQSLKGHSGIGAAQNNGKTDVDLAQPRPVPGRNRDEDAFRSHTADFLL